MWTTKKELLQSVLWDIRLKLAWKNIIKEWGKDNEAQKTIKPKDKKIMIAVNRIKVIQLSDGYIFEYRRLHEKRGFTKI
jgi:hypothetical protein